METITSLADNANALRLTPEAFDQFAALITSELGIKMSRDKIPMLQSRLQRRLRVLGLPSLEAYQHHLFHSPQGEAERQDFINAVTTNKTDFFREPEHFDYLVRTALPNVDPARGGRGPVPWRLKLWCAGCSSGEEPYTLSIVLSEFGASRGGFDFVMLATDISTRVLEHAQNAIYDEDRVDPVPMALRKKYLLRSRDAAKSQVRIVPELRRKVVFHILNFMEEEYPVRDEFEIIFFRNVMIYFDKPTQEKVINRLCRNLVPGGYLFVGHSESLTGLHIPVTPVAPAVYRKVA